MKRDSFNVLFFIKKAKLLKNGEASVCMRITVNGVRVENNIRKSIEPALWNQAKECAKGKSRKSCDLNAYIEDARIKMFDDRVEISNPGGLLPIVAKNFGHKSMTRNPLIFGLFTRMHLVERVASGIPRMQEAMREANLPEPEFHTEGMFTAVFKRGISIKNEIINVPSLSQECPKLDIRYTSIAEQIISYCSEPHSIQEIMKLVGQTNRSRFKKNIINPLLEVGILSMTIPNKPNSPLQQYIIKK